jgi:hypothetical protein
MTRGHGSTALQCVLRLFLVACVVVSPAFANTIKVPADQPTIQAGINAANNGDTVLVAPGTYSEHINFNGKAITVISSGGPGVTIIDGGNQAGIATVTFNSGEKNTSVISEFTIRGGGDAVIGGNGDGGVFVNGVTSNFAGASPVIQDNIITANYCHNIDVESAAATIRNNEISGVLQTGLGTCEFGSAIFLGGTPNYGVLGSAVTGNTIENNLTGSGVNLWAAQNVVILNNIIRNNTSADPGSAFTSANSVGTVLVQNLIYGNTSTCGGALGFENGGTGGVEAYSPTSPSILIANNTIVDNVTPKITNGAGSECTFIAYPGTVSACGTSETLTSSLNPSTVGESVIFTAALSSSSGTPTGSVQFLDGSNPYLRNRSPPADCPPTPPAPSRLAATLSRRTSNRLAASTQGQPCSPRSSMATPQPPMLPASQAPSALAVLYSLRPR